MNKHISSGLGFSSPLYHYLYNSLGLSEWCLKYAEEQILSIVFLIFSNLRYNWSSTFYCPELTPSSLLFSVAFSFSVNFYEIEDGKAIPFPYSSPQQITSISLHCLQFLSFLSSLVSKLDTLGKVGGQKAVVPPQPRSEMEQSSTTFPLWPQI